MKLITVYLMIISHFGNAAGVWPAPQSFTHGESVVWIRKDIVATYNGRSVRWSSESSSFQTYYSSWASQTESFLRTQLHLSAGRPSQSSALNSEEIVQRAVQRALTTIFSENFVPWKFYPRNELLRFEPSASYKKIYIKSLAITQTEHDKPSAFRPLAGQVDESYSLKVEADGKAIISAISYQGVLHALETFTQLFYTHSQGSGIYSNLAPISISDGPKFSHRGLNLDVSRNWYPKLSILRIIDALAWNKFNRFHIHMTDGQSWPMEIPSLPELSQKGAYQSGLSYSPADIAEIQSYGVYRGVQVYLEIDMPGHTSAIALAYPNLIAAFDQQPWDSYCAEPPCGTLKLNSTAVSQFLEKLFDDVLPRVTPYSAYFHTGGDEINLNAYLLDETVNSNDRSVLKPLLQNFVDRNHAQIRKAGLAPLVWEEMALDWGLELGDDVVVQTWTSESSVSKVTALGHKAIFGNYNFWVKYSALNMFVSDNRKYLDCGKGQWLNFAEGASFQTYYPFNDYCSPVKNWRIVYSYDPTAGLTDAQKKLVLGGEVHMWSEQTDAINLDDTVWPRASAAGEVLWSGRQDSSGENRSQLDAAPRLAEMRERMVTRGVNCGPVQMVFCTQHDSTECGL